MKSYPANLLCLTLLFALFSCSEDGAQNNGNPGNINPNAIIYDGPAITFTKADYADFTQPGNQDRITDNVWLTRGTQMGLFNIRVENEFDEFFSPEDTEWAEGTLEDLENLVFADFKTASGGQQLTRNLPGKTFVVHLITDDIYLQVTFVTWSRGETGGGGGFSYQRTTPGQ